MANLADRFIHVRDVVADDDLVLAAALHNRDNTVRFFEHIGLGFALILELEAQTGNAVRQRDDVALAAHILDNNARKAAVFTSHKSILLLIGLVSFFGQFKPETAVLQMALRHSRLGCQSVGVRKALVFERDRKTVSSPGDGGHIFLAAQQRVEVAQQVLLRCR